MRVRLGVKAGVRSVWSEVGGDGDIRHDSIGRARRMQVRV